MLPLGYGVLTSRIFFSPRVKAPLHLQIMYKGEYDPQHSPRTLARLWIWGILDWLIGWGEEVPPPMVASDDEGPKAESTENDSS